MGEISLFDDLGVKPQTDRKVVDGDSLFTHLGIDAPKDKPVIREVPKNTHPGPNGLMWNADGGYDPKTGELVVAGKPFDRSSLGFMGGARALVDGVTNGVPIVGPAIKGGTQRAAAMIATAGEPQKLSDLVTGETPYFRALKTIQQQSDDAASAHRYASIAGHLTGAASAYTFAGMPAFGSKVLGFSGNMAPRMAYGAVSNALIGGADAAVRGQDPVVGGAVGLVGGTAAPVVGAIIGAGANKLTGMFQNIQPTGIPGVSRPAANMVNRAIAADDPQAVQAGLAKLGEQGMLADAGPSLTGVTRAIRDEPGQGSAIVHQAITGRAGGSNDRIAAQLTESLGPAKDPTIAAREIAAQRATVNKAYQAVHAGAPPVDVGGVVQNIDKALETATGAQKTALQKIKGTLIAAPAQLDEAGNVIAPAKYIENSQTLHNLRQDIDAVINHGAPGLGVEQGAVSRTQGALKTIRGALDDALKTQVPGMAETDAKSAILARAQNAVDRGYKEVLGANGPHPETFAADRLRAGASENVAENIGIRARIDRMFGTGTQRDAVTLNKLLAGGEDGYATANLKTAFGEQPVNKLLDTLSREKTFANTTQEVIGNSATSRSKAAGEWLKEGTPGSANLNSANLTGVALQTAKRWIADPLVSMILRTSSEPMRAEMAQVLTMQGQSRDQVVSKLLALHQRQGQIGAVGGAISKGANAGANRLMMGASGTMRPDL